MATDARRDLVLDSLAAGFPALTAAFGKCLAEAGAACLDEYKHQQGIVLEVSGDFSESFNLYWPQVTDQIRRCWNDIEVAREHGAYGIACLLIRKLTPFTVIERSRKGTGFDYWLGFEGDLLFQNKARLEVSGIGKGSPGLIARRVKIKLQQTERSDGALPVYIVVEEFSTPASQVAVKEG